jgi:hypothetical protein
MTHPLINMARCAAVTAAVLLLLPALNPAGAEESTRDAADYDMRAHYDKQEVMIPMRDGVRLFTAIYTPRDTSHTYPILLHRTPYSIGYTGAYGETYTDIQFMAPSPEFVYDGYIFVDQDIRGTFRSEGEFLVNRPITHLENPDSVDESTDNYDTIECCTMLPTTTGGSVSGVFPTWAGPPPTVWWIHTRRSGPPRRKPPLRISGWETTATTTARFAPCTRSGG